MSEETMVVDIFDKEYSGESIVDLYRDIAEAIDSNYNQEMHRVALNDYNIPKGTFKVSIRWEWDYK